MITFHKKVKPAEEYFKFQPCCEKMKLYTYLFNISDTNISIQNPDRYSGCGGNQVYSIDISYCPFCGEKFEVE